MKANKVRDNAIDSIVSNLIMAGLLLPEEVGRYMVQLGWYDDIAIASQLCESRNLWGKSLEIAAQLRKN